MKWTPYDINGSIFRPMGKLLLVEEPDFGCEGVPEEEPVYGSVVVQKRGEEKKHTVPIEENILFSGRMDDGMWYGILGGKMVLVDRDRKTVIAPNDAERQWLEQL